MRSGATICNVSVSTKGGSTMAVLIWSAVVVQCVDNSIVGCRTIKGSLLEQSWSFQFRMHNETSHRLAQTAGG